MIPEKESLDDDLWAKFDRWRPVMTRMRTRTLTWNDAARIDVTSYEPYNLMVQYEIHSERDEDCYESEELLGRCKDTKLKNWLIL